MGIGVSVFLLAVGAILAFAVTGSVEGINLDVVGIILMVAGALGLLWSLMASSMMPWRQTEVIEDDGARRYDHDHMHA